MIFIILTALDAADLHLLYLTAAGKVHKPTPVPLTTGEFVLSAELLTDPLYIHYHQFLGSLPQRQPEPYEFINDLPGDIQ